MALSDITEIIDDARNGRMYILIDDETPENQGDLVIPAQMASPDTVNFMARFGRGLICLALAQHRIDELGLNQLPTRNQARSGSAFTSSIEAKEGVTTGISAKDRARTIAVAINGVNGAEDIVSPGHVFPLAAKDGGVLIRAGHTEAAVDIARLAGLNPSGVICEILSDDGSVARLPELEEFAAEHGLKIGAISDLIAHRMKHDHNIERVSDEGFSSNHAGDWRAITMRNTAIDATTLALVKGEVGPSAATMVRMHGFDLFTDALSENNGRSEHLEHSMAMIDRHGSGVVVILPPPTGNLVSRFKKAQPSDVQSDEEMETLRDYGLGAQVLAELGVHQIISLTNSRLSYPAMSGYGLNIIEERKIIAP